VPVSSIAMAASRRITTHCIKATRRIVLYPGKERYKLDPKTEVMPLEKLLSEEMTRGKHELRRRPI
jgi:hypothetical protein